MADQQEHIDASICGGAFAQAEIKRLRAINAKLLAACEAIIPASKCPYHPDSTFTYGCCLCRAYQQAVAAVAEAKESA